jgi:hypothetical protein
MMRGFIDFATDDRLPLVIYDRQEVNLKNNWNIRKDSSSTIAEQDGYAVWYHRDDFGKLIFYVVKGNDPLGYVSCYIDLDNHSVIVNSTYFSPEERLKGLGTLAYKSILGVVDALISDTSRTSGAEALWQSLERDASIEVHYDDHGRYVARRIR